MEPGNKVEVSHHRDRRKKSPGVSASIDGENRRLYPNLPSSSETTGVVGIKTKSKRPGKKSTSKSTKEKYALYIFPSKEHKMM